MTSQTSNALTGTYFVTATDTEVGKTFVSGYLLREANQQGLKTLGLKPVASGADNGVNEDARHLQACASIKKPLSEINPFCMEEAAAPHIVAKSCGLDITVAKLVRQLKSVMTDEDFDLCLIEGAGGWCVPINDNEMWVDLVKALNIPVLFVVGMRLGCLNHAILSVKVMQSQGIHVAGWYANCLSSQPMAHFDENLATLERELMPPLLGVVPYGGTS